MFDLFSKGRALRTLTGVRRVLGGAGGGIRKRIDDNRALSDLIWREAPHLLAQHHWVLRSLQDNESFLVELSQAALVDERDTSVRTPAAPMAQPAWSDTEPLPERFGQ